jgi:hypothetical protein
MLQNTGAAKTAFFILLFLFFSSGVSAQLYVMPAADSAYEKGLAIYMYTRDSAAIEIRKNPSSASAIFAKVDKGLAFFDSAQSSTYSSTIIATNYFHANLLFEKALLYSISGDHEKSYALFLQVKNEFEKLDKENEFPVSYYWKHLEYQAKRESFDNKFSNVYAGLVNQSFQLQNDQNVLSWGRQARARIFSNLFLVYSVEQQMIGSKQHLQQYDQEMLDLSLALLTDFSKLDEQGVSLARQDDDFGVAIAYRSIVKTLSDQPELDRDGSYRAKAAPLLGWAGLDKEEELLYEQAMDNGYGDDSFFSELSSVASNHKNKALEQKTCDTWYSKIKDNGDGFYLKVLALHYDDLGNPSRSAELKKRAAACAKRDAKEKRAAEKNR